MILLCICGFKVQKMEINPISYATPTSASSGMQNATALSSDFNTFLRMLTVQMQNQDPLNPMQASDFAVQLATFSGVEQQVRSNQLLQTIANHYSVTSLAQFAGWIGQEARSAAEPVWYGGAPVTLFPNPVQNADAIVLVVRDGEGALVAREVLPLSNQPYQWFGADAAGNRLPNGQYNLSLEHSNGGEIIAESAIEYYGRVTEARVGSDAVVLVLEGGVELPVASVTGLKRSAGG